MNSKISPVKNLNGTIHLPASKSYSIRAFIIAACGGKSLIVQPSNSDDAKVALSVARKLGARIIQMSGNRWKAEASQKPPGFQKINVKESGTTLRFLLPLVAAIGKKSVIIGEGTLQGRPNAHLLKALRTMGVAVKGTGKKESVPVRFNGGRLQGGKIKIDGSLSSQFVSALLIAAPLLDSDTELNITGKKIVSTEYITMTRQILQLSGIKINHSSQRRYTIKGNQKFLGLRKFIVPSDYGLAAFFMAAGALLKSDILLRGHLNDKLVQADGAICGLLKRMGVKFQRNQQFIRIQGPFQLKGGSFSLKDAPDLVPIMTVLSMFARGRTRLYDIGHVRAKESDRISDLRKELLKTGAKITEKRNEIIIDPQEAYRSNAVLNPHQDHRLAMAFSVLGLKLGAIVQDIECTRKSYPDFTRDLQIITG